MGKRIIALIISFLLGLVATPAILSNADGFTPSVVAFDDQKTVEIKHEKKQETVAVSGSTKTQANTGAATNVPAAPNASAVQPETVVTPTINYNVTYVVGSAQEFNSIAQSLSYSDIYRFKKLVYGHNSSNLLGNLSSLGAGSEFTVTEGGVATTYRVASKVTYRYEDLQGNMNSIVNTASGHKIALMTCAGTPDGHGGASHRLVVFADAI